MIVCLSTVAPPLKNLAPAKSLSAKFVQTIHRIKILNACLHIQIPYTRYGKVRLNIRIRFLATEFHIQWSGFIYRYICRRIHKINASTASLPYGPSSPVRGLHCHHFLEFQIMPGKASSSTKQYFCCLLPYLLYLHNMVY